MTQIARMMPICRAGNSLASKRVDQHERGRALLEMRRTVGDAREKLIGGALGIFAAHAILWLARNMRRFQN
jgi:hypothetical protein